MCDTALHLDEEEMKVNTPSQLLPEPLLLILSPPPPFLPITGAPTMLWPKWLKAFEQYIQALGKKELSDSSIMVLLQNSLGQEGERIFTTLIPNETTYSAAVSTLTFYFTSDQTAQQQLLKFHQRAQMPGETLNQFVSALEDLLRPCGCENFKETLILNQLIAKTIHPPLRERLLPKRDEITLAMALAIGEEVEIALKETQPLDFHEFCVQIDDLDPPVQLKRKRGRPRKGEERPKIKTEVVPPVQVKRKRGRPRKGEERPKIKPSVAKIRTPSLYKKDYYCSDDKQYSWDDVKSQEADVADLNCGLSTSSGIEEESNSEKYDDEDFALSSTKQKGPRRPGRPNRRFREARKLTKCMETHTNERRFSCPECEMTFTRSYHLTRHRKNQHGVNMYICPICGLGLRTYGDFQQHKKMHKTQLLCSPTCDENFTNNDELSNHVKSHHGNQDCETKAQSSEQSFKVKTEQKSDAQTDCSDETNSNDKTLKPHSSTTEDSDVLLRKDGSNEKNKKSNQHKGQDIYCPICVDRSFRGPNKLARHMRTHTKEKPFTCPVCNLTFSQSYHMTRHVRNQHSQGQYICSKCGESFSTWLELKSHKRTHAVEGLTCLACDKQFKGKSALGKHLKLHRRVETNQRNLSCGDCGKVFGRTYHLKRHIMTHRKGTNGESYTCPDCHKIFAFPEDLNKHLEIHVNKNSGTCPKCQETFGSAEELEIHLKTHQKSYPCSTCGRKFKVEYALKKHELMHQCEEYYCSTCRKHFFKFSHYKRHMMVHDKRESKCPYCNAVFLKLIAFKYHLRTHTEERPHQCSCCIETFEQKEELEQHCLKHRKFKIERPYSCSRCDYAFSTLSELTEHMTSHDGEPPQTCPVCGRTFLNKNKLERHLTIHNGERPHLCSICGNGYPSAASLKLHFVVHTGEKLYQCPQCSKSFSSASGLRLHSRHHMEQPPSFDCLQCGRSYGRMTELKMHQRYHTGDKPYSCTCCSKRFISKDKLNVHMRTHTGERPYSCPTCGQTFTQTGDRNRHMSKYHGISK